MPFMKLQKGDIDFSEWIFDENEKLNAIIAESATEVIRDAFDESAPYLTLPSIWNHGENPSDGTPNGIPVTDQLTIDLSLSLGSDDKEPWYRLSFSEVAEEFVEDLRPGGDNSGYAIDEENKQRIRKLTDALRLLADGLETRMNSGIPYERNE